MTRPPAVLALMLAASGPALADRPFAPSLSCDSLVRLVDRNGGVVVSTSRTTYDRYVSDARFCQPTEVTKAAWVRSADEKNCFVGYTCEEHMRDDLW